MTTITFGISSEETATFQFERDKIIYFVAISNGKIYSFERFETDFLPALLIAYKIDPQEKFYQVIARTKSYLTKQIKTRLLEVGVCANALI